MAFRTTQVTCDVEFLTHDCSHVCSNSAFLIKGYDVHRAKILNPREEDGLKNGLWLFARKPRRNSVANAFINQTDKSFVEDKNKSICTR